VLAGSFVFAGEFTPNFKKVLGRRLLDKIQLESLQPNKAHIVMSSLSGRLLTKNK
jgi:hypothetical protein